MFHTGDPWDVRDDSDHHFVPCDLREQATFVVDFPMTSMTITSGNNHFWGGCPGMSRLIAGGYI